MTDIAVPINLIEEMVKAGGPMVIEFPDPLRLRVGENDYRALRLLQLHLGNKTADLLHVAFLHAIEEYLNLIEDRSVPEDEAFESESVQTWIALMWWLQYFTCEPRYRMAAPEEADGISPE